MPIRSSGAAFVPMRSVEPAAAGVAAVRSPSTEKSIAPAVRNSRTWIRFIPCLLEVVEPFLLHEHREPTGLRPDAVGLHLEQVDAAGDRELVVGLHVPVEDRRRRV